MMLEKKCRKHWEKLGIKSLAALKEYINAIFEKHNHQEYVLIELYKMVFPDWGKIDKINGYPEAGNELWTFICRCFQEFDRRNHPDCLPGGAWMNIGFSVNRHIAPWEISLKNCSLEYMQEKYAVNA